MTERAVDAAFLELFSSEENCAKALYHSRWPDGYRCPLCGCAEHYLIRTRRLPLFECKSCRYQASLTAGTILEGSSTPLNKWFKAIHLLTLPGGISATRLTGILEVTYKTAWLIAHKIREAMHSADEAGKLSDFVQVMSFGYGAFHYPDSCQPVLLGASFDGEDEIRHIKLHQPDPDHVRLPERTILKEGYRAFISNEVRSSEVSEIPFYGKANPKLSPIRHELRSWLTFTFRGIGAKHLQAYLTEFCFRSNRKLNSQEDTSFSYLLSWCASTARITYRYLTRPRRTLPVAWRTFETKSKWINMHRRSWG
ncbi:transposase [Cohnella sp. AR92]|uniref:transposase n=1 Tax=Cohnella sp. AR92 TaxID=648716 RepID=UPI0013150F09|nr:transposase [Cohnella sp. AR92]